MKTINFPFLRYVCLCVCAHACIFIHMYTCTCVHTICHPHAIACMPVQACFACMPVQACFVLVWVDFVIIIVRWSMGHGAVF